MKHPSRRAWLALSVGAMLVLTLGPGLAVAADADVSMVEEDEQYKFEPAEVTVEVGDSVTWTNDSDAPHTVTADDDSFDHDGIDPTETAQQTFDAVGDVAYHCEIHENMTGVVHVVATGTGATPPPTDTQAVDQTTAGGLPWLPIAAGLIALVVLVGLWQRPLISRERP